MKKSVNYAARVIDQSVTGVETAQNTPLGEGYTVVMRVYGPDIAACKEPTKAWKELLDTYFLDRKRIEADKIVGFIYGDNITVVLKDYNVVYVVNDEGKTVERVYGQIVRY